MAVIAGVAAVSGEYFEQAYDTFMPGVINILVNCRGNQFKALRGRAVECVGLIAAGVGRQKFQNDFQNVMQLFMNMFGKMECVLQFLCHLLTQG